MQIQIQFFIPYNVQDKRTIRVEKKERKKMDVKAQNFKQ
jgi:hypothetical protein